MSLLTVFLQYPSPIIISYQTFCYLKILLIELNSIDVMVWLYLVVGKHIYLYLGVIYHCFLYQISHCSNVGIFILLINFPIQIQDITNPLEYSLQYLFRILWSKYDQRVVDG